MIILWLVRTHAKKIAWPTESDELSNNEEEEEENNNFENYEDIINKDNNKKC